jgi:MraZ protein
MFRGSFLATIDEKSRLKIPRDFRVLIEEKFGRDLFVTSLHGDGVRIFPMPAWLDIEKQIGQDRFRDAAARRFLKRVNYYGQPAELDNQGRVLIHQRLRDTAEMSGEVDVVGQLDYLEVWNRERITAQVLGEPFTQEDEDALASRLRHDA